MPLKATTPPTPPGHWLLVAVAFTLMLVISALAFHFDSLRRSGGGASPEMIAID